MACWRKRKRRKIAEKKLELAQRLRDVRVKNSNNYKMTSLESILPVKVYKGRSQGRILPPSFVIPSQSLSSSELPIPVIYQKCNKQKLQIFTSKLRVRVPFPGLYPTFYPTSPLSTPPLKTSGGVSHWAMDVRLLWLAQANFLI